MTDHTTSVPDEREYLDHMDDLELITRYLNGRLDPERVEAVRRRLDEDAEFRHLAAPMLLTWSIPKHLERYPRPEGELEREWAEFTRRAGIVEEYPAPPTSRWQRFRHWRHWKGLRVLVLLLVGAYFIGAQAMYSSLEDRVVSEDRGSVVGGPAASESQFSPVSYDTGWIALNDGIDVQLTAGASLEVGHQRLRNMKHVRLEGEARFRVSPIETVTGTLRSHALLIDTHAGEVAAGESDFTITVRADTTVVQVHPLGPRRALEPARMTVMATVVTGNASSRLPIRDLEGARLVRGRATELITTTPR
jgi:hypothetical protein